jgi:cytochrome c oxidase subunit 2
MLGAAGLFWWAVLEPMGESRAGPFVAPLLLFATAVSGGLLGALMTLAGHPWYAHYARVADAAGFSALVDQQLAGLLMWVPPGLLYVGMACVLLYRALAKVGRRRGRGLRIASTVFSGIYLTSLGVGRAQVLDTSGPAASGTAQIFWVMVIIAAATCLLVFILLFTAVFRPGPPGGGKPPLGDAPFVILGGIVLPLVILIPLLFWSLGLTAGMARPADDDTLTIEVIGHQWWWEVRYPDAGVTDANEIHIPAGRPVRLLLSSEDVIHSFWAPGLQGKMDLIPGTVNSLWIEADEPGIHSAKCAEYCGAQHANMRLLVVSEREENFAGWLAERQEVPPSVPTDPLVRKGQEVFLSSACVYCHTIEGTNASGRLGPDLTHLAGRMTLGAGTLANNRGNLGGWVVNSQAHKPGNRMPPMYLESEDLLALLAYLESLE